MSTRNRSVVLVTLSKSTRPMLGRENRTEDGRLVMNANKFGFSVVSTEAPRRHLRWMFLKRDKATLMPLIGAAPKLLPTNGRHTIKVNGRLTKDDGNHIFEFLYRHKHRQLFAVFFSRSQGIGVGVGVTTPESGV